MKMSLNEFIRSEELKLLFFKEYRLRHARIAEVTNGTSAGPRAWPTVMSEKDWIKEFNNYHNQTSTLDE